MATTPFWTDEVPRYVEMERNAASERQRKSRAYKRKYSGLAVLFSKPKPGFEDKRREAAFARLAYQAEYALTGLGFVVSPFRFGYQFVYTSFSWLWGKVQPHAAAWMPTTASEAWRNTERWRFQVCVL